MAYMSLYRCTVTPNDIKGYKYRYGIGLFNAIKSIWSEFSEEDKIVLKGCIMKFRVDMSNPPTEVLLKDGARCWFTEKGYNLFRDNIEAMNKVLNKYGVKITLNLKVLNDSDNSILYNDGLQVVLWEKVDYEL